MCLKIKNITFTHDANNILLENINLNITRDDRIGIIGETGSGKSTLLKIIMGLLPTQSGTIELFNKQMRKENDFAKLRLQMGYLFQNANDQLFCPTVLDDVIFGPLNCGLTKKQALIESKAILEKIKIEHLENKLTTELSGGEKKLVALATILAMKPKLLLLDEPATGLDQNTKNRIIDIIQSFNGPLITISHDWNFLEKITNKIYKLENKKLVFNGQLKIHQHTHIHPLGDVDHEHSKIES